MSWLLWVLAVEYAGLGLLALGAAIQRARERAALNRLAVLLFTRPPVSLSPPTTAELVGPEWILPPRTRPPSPR